MTDHLAAYGKSMPLAAWAKLPLCRVDETELRRRIGEGWSPEEALTLPRGTPPGDRRQMATGFPKEYESRLPEFERGLKPQGETFKRHSKFIGVSKRKNGTFYAQIRNGRDTVEYLGDFAVEVEAAIAYDKRATELGKRLNFE